MDRHCRRSRATGPTPPALFGRRRATRHRSSRSEHREAVVSQELSTSDRKTDRSLDADRRLRTLARPEAPEVRRRAGWRPLFPYRVSPVGRRGDLPFDVQATQRTASICRDPPRSAVIDDRETLDNRAFSPFFYIRRESLLSRGPQARVLARRHTFACD